MADVWWEEISLINNNNTLRQGDYLLDCSVVNIRADFDVVNEEGKDRPIVDVDKVNLKEAIALRFERSPVPQYKIEERSPN
jgi:hypothetical protein